LVVLALVFMPSLTEGTSRTSVGLLGAYGMPVGWWADRWDPLQSGEVNFRYEFSPVPLNIWNQKFGILLLTGLNKTYFTPLSKEEVVQESLYSDVRDVFDPYRNTINASQGGSFKQLPVGFGFYYERTVWRFHVYSSLAMAVYSWKFERSQELLQEITVAGMDTIRHEYDNWSVKQVGSDLGGQLAIGAVYRIWKTLCVDVSAADHLINISREVGAVAYWGIPAQVPPGEPANELIENAKGAVDFLQFRIGLRVES